MNSVLRENSYGYVFGSELLGEPKQCYVKHQTCIFTLALCPYKTFSYSVHYLFRRNIFLYKIGVFIFKIKFILKFVEIKNPM